MEDFLKQYRKHKLPQNVAIITASLFLALWVNMQFTDNNLWKYLKANLIESESQEQKSDVYLEVKGNKVLVKNGTPIQWLQQIQFSLMFNHEALDTSNVLKNIDNYTIRYNYLDYWILNIQLISKNPEDISIHSPLIELDFMKKTEMKEYVNILNANFSDTDWRTYHMTTTGTSL